MKNVFLAVFVIGIIFCSQLANFEKVEAKDVYSYNESGVEYYITGIRNLMVGNFGSFVKGVSGGKAVKYFYFVFNKQNNVWIYQIHDVTNGMAKSHMIEQGYLSNSGKAQNVFNVTKNNWNTINQIDEEQEKLRKQQEESKRKNLQEQMDKAEPLLDKALECFKKKQYDKCIELHKQAIAIAPDYQDSYEYLALVYANVGKSKLGIDLMTSLLSNPKFDKAGLFFTRGQIFEMIGNKSEAGKDYGEALRHSKPGTKLRKEIEQARQSLWSRSV